MESSPGTAAPIGDRDVRAGRRRVVMWLTAVVATLLTVTGCAAGQIAQTAEEVPVIDGAEATVGQIGLRGVTIAPPDQSWAKGTEAALQLVIANSGTTDDTLTGISTSAASAVQIRDSGAPSCTAGSLAPSTNSGTGSSAVTGSAPASSATSAPSSASSPSGPGSAASGSVTVSAVGTLPATASASCSNSVGAIPVKAGTAVSIGYSTGDQQIVLQDLTQTLYPSQPIQITFTFANAGPVTMTVTVKLSAASSSASVIPSLTND